MMFSISINVSLCFYICMPLYADVCINELLEVVLAKQIMLTSTTWQCLLEYHINTNTDE